MSAKLRRSSRKRKSTITDPLREPADDASRTVKSPHTSATSSAHVESPISTLTRSDMDSLPGPSELHPLKMTASILCGPCQIRAKSSLADYWCHECDDLLCKECSSHHKANKMSRRHSVISVDYYKKLPESVRKISSLCPDHGLKYHQFCRSHSALCCPVCAEGTHKSCPDLQLLDEIIKTVDKPSLINEVETKMKEIKSNLERVISERDQNISGLRKQKQEIKEKFGTLRFEVTQHIDALDDKIQNELSRLEENEVEKLKHSMSDLTASLDMIENKLEETTMLKKYGSDLQTFLGTRELETFIEKKKASLENSIKNGSHNTRELQCDINDKIKAIMSDITTFGSISVISKPCTVGLKSGKDKQVQSFPSSTQQKRIEFEDATVKKKKKKIKVPGLQKSYLSGCSVFSNDKVVIADDKNKRVIIITESGTIEKTIPIREGEARDVTVIDDRSIAVSSDKGVRIIDVDTGEVEKSFDIGRCYGLSYHDGVLYCCAPTKGVVSIELSSGRSKTIISVRDDTWSFCFVAAGLLYYTRANMKGVQCFSIKDMLTIWEYEDTTLIHGPRGVTADSFGNVYLASYIDHLVLMISPDGQRCRPILSEIDRIKVPWGLCFNNNKNELYVLSNWCQCFQYMIH